MSPTPKSPKGVRASVKSPRKLLTAFQDSSNLAPSWSRVLSTAKPSGRDVLDRDPRTKFLSLDHGRLRSGQDPTGGARVYRPARAGGGAGAGAVGGGVGAVRVEHPAVAHLRGDRRAAGRAQAARRRARGRGRPVGRAGVRDVSARAEVPLPRAQVRLRRAAVRRAGHRARGPGGAAAGGVRELGLSSARPPACSATSTATWARRSGPTSACTCRPSCCCSAPKGCTAARRWRGRCTARPSRRCCRRRKGSSSSAACRSGTRTTTVAHPRTARAPLEETVTFAA